MKKISYLVSLMCFCGSLTNMQAQSSVSIQTPKWVLMMEDPNVNYFDAVKSYDEYWKTHKKPASEAETFDHQSERSKEASESQEQREKERLEKLGPPMSGAELEQAEYLKYQSKRFDKWMMEVKPWVQENGHILTYEERQTIWKKQQEESREQEKKK